ncbi:MAG: hypothetical protein R3B93_23605 [Bacteroidia bacterium]
MNKIIYFFLIGTFFLITGKGMPIFKDVKDLSDLKDSAVKIQFSCDEKYGFVDISSDKRTVYVSDIESKKLIQYSTRNPEKLKLTYFNGVPIDSSGFKGTMIYAKPDFYSIYKKDNIHQLYKYDLAQNKIKLVHEFRSRVSFIGSNLNDLYFLVWEEGAALSTEVISLNVLSGKEATFIDLSSELSINYGISEVLYSPKSKSFLVEVGEWLGGLNDQSYYIYSLEAKRIKKLPPYEFFLGIQKVLLTPDQDYFFIYTGTRHTSHYLGNSVILDANFELVDSILNRKNSLFSGYSISQGKIETFYQNIRGNNLKDLRVISDPFNKDLHIMLFRLAKNEANDLSLEDFSDFSKCELEIIRGLLLLKYNQEIPNDFLRFYVATFVMPEKKNSEQIESFSEADTKIISYINELLRN